MARATEQAIRTPARRASPLARRLRRLRGILRPTPHVPLDVEGIDLDKKLVTPATT